MVERTFALPSLAAPCAGSTETKSFLVSYFYPANNYCSRRP